MKFIILKFKKEFWSILFLLFSISLIVFSKSNIISVKSSINICINNVIPSLLPFFIATELLNKSNVPQIFEKIFSKIMKPVFNVPGIGSYALFMGMICGYPIGAKIVTNFRKNNFCTKEEAERLITFTNNSGPLFIIGTVGITLFLDATIGLVLLFTHIAASLTVGFIFRFWKCKRNSTNTVSLNKTITLNSFGEILSTSIISAIKSITIICGFVIFFGILLSILKNIYAFNILNIIFSPIFNILHINLNFITPFFTGLIELTNGINLVSSVISKSLGINVIICAFLLGFGGFSIMFQVLSIISKSDISIKPYIIGKLLHGIIAAIYTFLIINNFGIFRYLL